jgi:spermidine/putrescine-binding protein
VLQFILKKKNIMSKIEIQVGQIKVHYEGDDNYIKTELPALLDKLIHQSKSIPTMESSHTEVMQGKANGAAVVKVGTTNAIAGRINAKTGSDLFTAAAAKLYFVDKKESFSRIELIKEIRSATQYFKETYVGNGSSILKSLGKTTLNEASKDRFSLTASAIADLGPKLAS